MLYKYLFDAELLGYFLDEVHVIVVDKKYCKIFDIRRTKSENLNVSCVDLQLSLRNILKPRVKWRMKM